LEGGEGGVVVANFSDEDDIGGLAHGATEAASEGGGITTDFALGEEAVLVGEDVFDGVFDGDDVAGGVFVQPLEERGESGGFAGAGGAGDEDDAVGFESPAGEEPIGGAEVYERRDVSADAAEDGADAAKDAVEVDAEADALLGDEAGVFVEVEGGVGTTGGPEGDHVCEGDGFLTEEHDLFVDLETGRLAFLKEDVASLVLIGGGEDVVDVHAEKGNRVNTDLEVSLWIGT
jgi:hypothetical protein